MSETASSPAYEQDAAAPLMEDAESALPTKSVSGQASAESPSRALIVKAQTDKSSDSREAIDTAEKMMMMSVEDKAPGEVRDC
jgi:hypothetical protein